MAQQPLIPEPKGNSTWDRREEFVREHVQRFIQARLEEEVTKLLGRAKASRRTAGDAPPGYRNGHSKPRRLSLTSETITVRRPRVRGLNERFVSRVLPLSVAVRAGAPGEQVDQGGQSAHEVFRSSDASDRLAPTRGASVVSGAQA